MYRLQQGASDPTLVFVPILFATSASTLVGLLTVAFVQRLPLWRPVAGLPAAAGLCIAALVAFLSDPERHGTGQPVVPHRQPDAVWPGAAVRAAGRPAPRAGVRGFCRRRTRRLRGGLGLLPYLVAMLCAIGVLRASGALGYALTASAGWSKARAGTRCFVDALPTALVKPFSGSAARAMLIETMQAKGVDSFPPWSPPRCRAARKPPSMCWRCTLGRWGFRGCGTRCLVPCWRSWRGYWRRLGFVTGFG